MYKRTSLVRVSVLRTVLEVETEPAVTGARLDVRRWVTTEPTRVVVVAKVICVLERTSDCVHRF